MSAAAKRHPGWTLAVDYGPLLVFFLANVWSGVFVATAAFMAAIIVAVIVSKWKLRRISPMLWVSAILVVGLGGLTLWFHDFRIIQHKPTAIYALLSAMLFGGMLLGKPLLKYVLEAGYEGLSDHGWRILSRNWALFFAALAALNEALIPVLSPSQWIAFKVWGVVTLSFVFAAANIPMLMRHGLSEQPPPVPPQG